MLCIEDWYGDYKVSIKGLRRSVRARNVNEVLHAVRHYLARPSHCGSGKPRSCPFCRRNREELIGKKKASKYARRAGYGTKVQTSREWFCNAGGHHEPHSRRRLDR